MVVQSLSEWNAHCTESNSPGGCIDFILGHMMCHFPFPHDRNKSHWRLNREGVNDGHVMVQGIGSWTGGVEKHRLLALGLNA